ncbi:DUF3179 domain-containing protein [Haladaptatus caseinilyticus]|uniref:DUF3179 domain-containing protein n=1 Tax=Haladaptatus caseinilyticus TaxID=2993314 RepID=UPI00224ADA04|nr:DUF3179 domain-containing protein [Haladaptatus caseinilyticus]
MNVRQVIPRDAIPSVNGPEFGSAYDGNPDDRVVVFEPESGPVRAYPVRYLHYHEIVNDEPNGQPIAVTWCPLCGSAIVYSREASQGTLEFGVSGKLAADDLVMYDRETETEWKQSSGEAIAGELRGESLAVLPAALITWNEFRERHSDGLVLQPPGGESEASGPGDDPAPIDYDAEPYRAYFEHDGFGLDAHRGGDSRAWKRDDIDPKAVVLGLESDGDALGFPLPRVEDAGNVVTASIGEIDVVVFAADGIHAFEHLGFNFEYEDELFFRADGVRWHGASGESGGGRQLTRLPARRLFAFAWQDDHGEDGFWSPE